MKFVCEHCNSKYNIADNKIRNKVLKIRCRKCNNVIEVRDPALSPTPRSGGRRRAAAAKTGDQAGESVLEDRFAASFKGGRRGSARGTPGLKRAVQRSAETLGKDEADLAVWFVAIAGSPAGPIPAKSVHRHQKAKRVDDNSLVWKEGMPDWTALRNCKELVGLLARLDIEESLVGGPQQTLEEPKLGLFAEAGRARTAEPLKGRSVGLVSDRTDAAPAKPAASSAPAVLDEALGGIELEAPPAAAPEQLEGEFFSDDFSAGMESGLAGIQQISPPQVEGTDRWVKVAAVGFFGLAIVVLATVFFLTGGSGEQEVVEKVVEKVVKQVVEVEKEKIVYRDRPVEEGEIEGKTEDQSSGGGKKGHKGKGGGGKDLDAEKKKLLAQMGISSPSGDHKLVGATDEKQASGTGSGSSALSEQQIRATVNKNKGSLQLCYERSLKQGEAPEDRDIKVNTKFTVGASGMVKSVSIGGSGAKLPGLKACIQRSVKKWVFPSSSGGSPVEFPTLFTPK